MATRNCYHQEHKYECIHFGIESRAKCRSHPFFHDDFQVQKKASEETNRVIDSTRLPVSADREKLFYIEAVMEKTHHWHLVLPMCLPHFSTGEDTSSEYSIPMGAVLLPNN